MDTDVINVASCNQVVVVMDDIWISTASISHGIPECFSALVPNITHGNKFKVFRFIELEQFEQVRATSVGCNSTTTDESDVKAIVSPKNTSVAFCRNGG